LALCTAHRPLARGIEVVEAGEVKRPVDGVERELAPGRQVAAASLAKGGLRGDDDFAENGLAPFSTRRRQEKREDIGRRVVVEELAMDTPDLLVSHDRNAERAPGGLVREDLLQRSPQSSPRESHAAIAQRELNDSRRHPGSRHAG
jgi:hypothetical protein